MPRLFLIAKDYFDMNLQSKYYFVDKMQSKAYQNNI